MKLRHLVCLLLTCCLLCGLAVSVSAEEADNTALQQAIIDACVYRQDADLSDYKLPQEELDDVFDELYYSGRLPWYISGSYNYTYDTYTDFIITFSPSTLYEELDMVAYEQKMAEILDACVLPGMSKVQIALSLHDYLAANTVYDETLKKNTCYDLLIHGTSVCAGYAQAYQDLLLRAGIDCVYVVSDEMNHGWNLVSIDGNWYHVDVTWDDPTPNIEGRITHNYFLVTDAQISAGDNPHYGWDTDIVCQDTRFAESWWRDVTGQICFDSSESCYLIRTEEYTNSVYHRNEADGTERLLHTEKKNYIDIGAGNYMYDHTGLSLRGNKLYFSTLNAVLSMDLETEAIRTEYAHGNNTYISGSHVAGDTLKLTLMTHDAEASAYTQALEPLGGHAHSYSQTVQAPTCSAGGYTAFQCECGVTFRSAPVAPLPHNYERSFDSESSHYTCLDCGHSYTAPLLEEGEEMTLLYILLALALIILPLLRRKRKY